MSAEPRVAVIVLNWNNGPDTVECLGSLANSDIAVDVLVVDNGSEDDSTLQIQESGLAKEIIRTGRNLGYAGGNNVGLRRALDLHYKYVVVLNNDTFVAPDAIRRLCEHLGAAQGALALNPVIPYADGSGVWFAGGILDKGWPRHLQPRELIEDEGILRRTEILTGCCIAATPDTWRRVGLFDDAFFLIFEDSDWSLRARQRGVQLRVASDAVVAHKVSRSFRSGPMSFLGTFYFVRNGTWFHFRYARRYLPRFLVNWVLRPTYRAVRSSAERRKVLLAWAGLWAALTRHGGQASRRIYSIAAR